jgi:hypothetical protein
VPDDEYLAKRLREDRRIQWFALEDVVLGVHLWMLDRCASRVHKDDPVKYGDLLWYLLRR